MPTTAQACIDELCRFRRTLPHAVGKFGGEGAQNIRERCRPRSSFWINPRSIASPTTRSLASAVAVLAEIAPVVVAGPPERQGDLAFLITAGAVDFVARTGNFLPIVAGMLDRRLRMAERVAGMVQFPQDESGGRFRGNSSPRSEQSADRHSRQHRIAARAARPPAARRHRAPANHRRAGRAPARDRAAAFECVG